MLQGALPLRLPLKLGPPTATSLTCASPPTQLEAQALLFQVNGSLPLKHERPEPQGQAAQVSHDSRQEG
jgi:hypothetical protein